MRATRAGTAPQPTEFRKRARELLERSAPAFSQRDRPERKRTRARRDEPIAAWSTNRLWAELTERFSPGVVASNPSPMRGGPTHSDAFGTQKKTEK